MGFFLGEEHPEGEDHNEEKEKRSRKNTPLFAESAGKKYLLARQRSFVPPPLLLGKSSFDLLSIKSTDYARGRSTVQQIRG